MKVTFHLNLYYHNLSCWVWGHRWKVNFEFSDVNCSNACEMIPPIFTLCVRFPHCLTQLFSLSLPVYVVVLKLPRAQSQWDTCWSFEVIFTSNLLLGRQFIIAVQLITLTCAKQFYIRTCTGGAITEVIISIIMRRYNYIYALVRMYDIL